MGAGRGAGDAGGLEARLFAVKGLTPRVRRFYGWQAVYLETVRLLGRG